MARDTPSVDRLRFTDVRRIAETASTNDDVMALARGGAAEGIVVVADHQTSGRGRRGRTWHAPPGGSLLVTVLLRPPAEVADLVPMVAGVAMAEGVEAVAGVPAALKWPNDLVAPDDRKLGGMLAEADWRDGEVAVAVGFGVNVNWPEALPADLVDSAVALNHLTGAAVDRDSVLAAYLERLGRGYDALTRGDRAAAVAAWRSRLTTLGRFVRVELRDGSVTGTAVDVTDRGHLVLETREGERHTFAVGDVVHVRPAG